MSGYNEFYSGTLEQMNENIYSFFQQGWGKKYKLCLSESMGIVLKSY